MQISSENFGASDGAAGDFLVCLTSDSVEFSCRKHDSVAKILVVFDGKIIDFPF